MGISVVNTIVARHSQSHRLELAHNLNGGLLFQRTLSDVHSLVSLHAIFAVGQIAKLRPDPESSGPAGDRLFLRGRSSLHGCPVFFVRAHRVFRPAHSQWQR
jgi:hypothetical protein